MDQNVVPGNNPDDDGLHTDWAVRLCTEAAEDSDGCMIGTNVGVAVQWYKTKEEAERRMKMLEELGLVNVWYAVAHWNRNTETWDDEEGEDVD